jgi:hypothetical protein
VTFIIYISLSSFPKSLSKHRIKVLIHHFVSKRADRRLGTK